MASRVKGVDRGADQFDQVMRANHVSEFDTYASSTYLRTLMLLLLTRPRDRMDRLLQYWRGRRGRYRRPALRRELLMEVCGLS